MEVRGKREEAAYGVTRKRRKDTRKGSSNETRWVKKENNSSMKKRTVVS